MGHRMVIFDRRWRSGEEPVRDALYNADGMLWNALESRYGYNLRPLMSEVAADLGVNDELTRVILLGRREPSKAFLDAVGWERVTLYRRKESGHE